MSSVHAHIHLFAGVFRQLVHVTVILGGDEIQTLRVTESSPFCVYNHLSNIDQQCHHIDDATAAAVVHFYHIP